MGVYNQHHPPFLVGLYRSYQGQPERYLAGRFMALEAEPRFLWASKQFREIRQKGCAVEIDMLA